MATEDPNAGPPAPDSNAPPADANAGTDAAASSAAPPPEEGDTSEEAPPPQVDDSAVSSSAPPPDETASTDDQQNKDPHPDGITTEDVANTEGPPSDAGNTGGSVAADPNAEVSPTGTANVAGSAQADLSLAPPMADPSGSNTPAANLRQPLADGVDPAQGAASTTKDSLDPALMDPVQGAKDRVEGRTSDASLRSVDGPHIDEVPPDLTDGPKPSDGGPERYPFPQGGDVDVATVPDGEQAGEYLPNLTIEDSVILLEHELVPERLVGRRALVVDAPRYLIPVDKQDEVWITVRTRDEVNATLSLPLSAVEVHRGSVDVTVRG
jgi:hypothetical protein